MVVTDKVTVTPLKFELDPAICTSSGDLALPNPWTALVEISAPWRNTLVATWDENCVLNGKRTLTFLP